MPSAIIIGAGIGGLAAGARLARAGYQVSLFEQAARPGGRASTIVNGRFRFDTGPTLFLMPEVFAETFAALGECMEDHLDLVRLDPSYRVHFQDTSSLDLTAVLPHMRAQLNAIEPGSFEAFFRFLSEGPQHYPLALEHLVGGIFTSFFDSLGPKNPPLIFRAKPQPSHAANIARYFHAPRLQAAFSFQNMYLGLSPYNAPATYSLLQYTE